MDEWIERVHQCIARRFRHPESRRRSLEYLKRLPSPAERKNGCQLEEQPGDATPYGTQHLRSTYIWDATWFAMISGVRGGAPGRRKQGC